MSAHYGKPIVQSTTLRYRENPKTFDWKTIELDSDQWQEWLNSPINTGFHFTARIGEFSARKEKRRKGFFWYAYRKIHGQLFKKYLGKSEKLTITTLEHMAKSLATTYEVISSQ